MADPASSRKDRQARTRRELLAAAARVFAAKGYHAASVSQIAAAAGYTTGALYANFAHKEDLFLELIDEHLEVQQDDLEALLAETDPARLRALHRDLVAGAMRGLTEAGPVGEPAARSGELTMIQFWTLTLEFLLYAVRERPELRETLNRRYRPMAQQQGRVIAHWLETEGRESVLDPDELALAHSWLVEGLGIRLLQDPDLITPERAADLVTTLLFEAR